MPNWVSNNIEIEADATTAALVIEAIKNSDGKVDFNSILPMPECLREVTSPVRIVSQEKYDEAIKELQEAKAEGKNTDFFTIPLTAELQKEYQHLYGADNWYDWSVKNWGTKWNVHDVLVELNSLHFDTAWSAPFPIVVGLSARFPDVKIRFSWADEDMGYNLGYAEFLAGEELLVEEPQGSRAFLVGVANQIREGFIHWNDDAEDIGKAYLKEWEEEDEYYADEA